MKILITAAGGGHFAPLLAVMEVLPKDWDVLVVGRKFSLEGDKALSLEYQTAQKLDIPFHSITTGRLQRSFTKYTIPSLLKIPYGFLQGFTVVKRFCPDVILSFGGYVSLPVTVAAFLLGTPVVIHEQTLQAGLSNRISAMFARKICISWESSQHFFPKKKVVITGNPIRKELLLFVHSKKTKGSLSLLYITGGSLGSHEINTLFEEIIAKLVKRYRIVHQTGDAKKFGDFSRLEAIRNKLVERERERYTLIKFVESKNVGPILRDADLVISRAGIGIITELAYFNKPALLIPLPVSQNNEQLQNALFLKSIGLAKVVEEQSFSAKKLYSLINHMVDNIHTYKRNDAIEVLREDAALHIVNVVKKVVGEVHEKH